MLVPKPVLLASPLLALLGCASAAVSEAPARYPALPPGPSASSELPTFEPGPALTRVALACRPREPALPNALDDDCDGAIDDVAADDALVLAFAHPRGAPSRLWLRGDAGNAIELAAAPCSDESPFCTGRLATQQLARGRYTLVVQPTSGDTSEPHALLVAVQSQGKVTTYIAALEPAQRDQTMGQLALP